jgi:hypothetical protein
MFQTVSAFNLQLHEKLDMYIMSVWDCPRSVGLANRSQGKGTQRPCMHLGAELMFLFKVMGLR